MDIVQFFKFGLVGSSGLVIDFGVTWVFKEKLKTNKYISNSIGFLFGVTNNYFFNKYFTFNDNNSSISTQFLIFLTISIVGFLLNTLFLYLLQKNTKINFYVCKVLVIAIVFVWNFIANSLFTFR